MLCKMGAPERFGDGGESEKTGSSRSCAIPATIAAGLAGATYMLIQNRRAKRERMEEVGPRAYEVFQQWSDSYPMELNRPPRVQTGFGLFDTSPQRVNDRNHRAARDMYGLRLPSWGTLQ